MSMSSTRNHSKESRSFYSRSSSYSNDRSNLLHRQRPLSSLLIERDISSPSLDFPSIDDSGFFERRARRFFDDFDRRLRWRFYDNLFDDTCCKFGVENRPLALERIIPIKYQKKHSSTSTLRQIPVQHAPSSSTNYREAIYRTVNSDSDWCSSSFQQNNSGHFERRENRISSNDWLPPPESPTRKRTSMTIFVRPPRVQYSDAAYQQRTMSTSTYPTTHRTNYF